ncbi:MAG: Asp-tRNA(Asn)/Glu-tRNA(Gln) amidotransferase subunit GatA [Patescibacteria group bacterium]
MDLTNLTIGRIHEGLLHKDFSAQELTKEYLERIKNKNPSLNAFLAITEKEALASAKEVDSQIAQGIPVNPLTGVPTAVKDVIITKGIKTTAGSKMLETYSPPYDATVIEKLKEEGYVLLGKTNCDEFAMGGSNENSGFGPVKNPWDQSRVPGGSSGGSAAAVAADLAPYALGSDTGGSIRQPASFCGVVGLRCTYGSVSRYGLIAMASSLDQIGVFSRTVEDAETVFNVIKGHDPRDATSISPPPLKVRGGGGSYDVRGLKIGIPQEYVGSHWDAEGIENGVKKRVQEAIAVLEKLGAEVKMISLPHAPQALATYYVIVPSEVSSNLARFDGIRFGGVKEIHTSAYFRDKAKRDDPRQSALIEWYEQQRSHGFGPESKRRIMIGTHALSSGYYDAYYKKAHHVRLLLREDFAKAYQDVDVIACPTSPTVAFKIGAKANDPLAMYLADIFTVAVNLTGLPGISLPCGFAPAPDDDTGSPLKKGETRRGGVELPVGLQLIGKHFDEPLLFRTGKAYQQATDHHLKTPPLS